ncbi:MAG: hypothetical protein ACR2JS_02140 [Candidatus Nanopelagicales bacterium]
MKRSSALIGTAAAAAVLVAGSVAAMAAINTAASSAPAVGNIAVVDDQPMAAGSLAPIEIAPLPEIVPIAPASPVIVDAVDITSVEPTPAPSAKSSKSGKSSAKPKLQSSSTPMTQEARSLTASQAADIVMGQIDGSASVADVSRAQHDGYDSWAVTVDKADGSRLVGYVFTGATGADVFDWKVLKEPKPIVVTGSAPNAPASARPAKGDDDHASSEHADESEHHESHESDDDDD